MFTYNRLDEILKSKGLTAYQVSKDTGINQASFSDWKRGKSKPSAIKLKQLSDYLGVSIEYLMGEEDRPVNNTKCIEMYEIFEKLLNEKGLTAYKVAKDTGVSTATLTSWKQGIYTPKNEKLQKIADYFDVDLDYLLGTTTTRKAAKAAVLDVIRKKATKVPVLGSVPAGIPLEAIEDVIDYEEIDEDTAKKGEYFGLKIKGSSMYPMIMEDDVVIVRKQDTIESGQIGIVMVNGDEATCKKVVIRDGGIMLVGQNPEFIPLYYSAEEIETKPVRIIGRVVEIRRSLF